MRRVVVSGVGCVSPLGLDFDTTWRRLLRGDCGIVPLRDVPHFADGFPQGTAEQFPCQVAAPVPCGGAPEYRESGRRTRCAALAAAAADAALRDAGLSEPGDALRDMCGVAIGVGMGSLNDVASCTRALDAGRLKTVSPFFVPKILSNSPAGLISIERGLRGPNLSSATACAAGAHSIGDAARLVALGDADVMVAGGAEACLNPVAWAGFTRLKAMTPRHNADPRGASRPFDSGRAGFVMAEGAAVLILEELHHAVRRGARAYAEVVGYGASGDAHHVTAPAPDGGGMELAMRRALRRAAAHPAAAPAGPLRELAYVNAHATSTPLGDDIEARAVSRVVGAAAAGPVLISSTKGATGHLLGAAGAVEAAFAVAALHNRAAPHTLNLLAAPDDCPGLEFVAGLPHPLPAGGALALSNSFGFGGTNACLAFRAC